MPMTNDPLGVRAGSRFVISRSRNVAIDDRAVRSAAVSSAGLPDSGNAPDWRRIHLGQLCLTDEQVANYVLALDALNFRFWDEPRWIVSHDGRRENGYWALTMALRRALEAGVPLTDASYLANIGALDVARILCGESLIPDFPARLHNLREVGQALEREWAGSFLRCVLSADRSAAELLRRIVTLFPSFVDVRRYDGRTIPFYKRAQILIGDLAAAFSDRDPPLFDDLKVLTAFADYKVPQVLHQLGVLRYSAELEAILRKNAILPEGSACEVEIRAGTIVAVEHISSELTRLGEPLPAYAVDWRLWELGQGSPATRLPYHRTPTIAY